ncbi:MAG: BACON domain-containing protein [Desulfobacteraceae bacterium]|nr:BACON domain-containing protein [Desulfobacteraceae bacterium]
MTIDGNILGGEFFAAGEGNTILRYSYNEKTWENMQFTSYDISDIWISLEGNLFVVGYNGIFRYNGFGWDKMLLPYQLDRFGRIWGNSDDSIFVEGGRYDNETNTWYSVILHYNGNIANRWEEKQHPALSSIHDIWGTPDGKVFAVGVIRGSDYTEKLTIASYDGYKWTEMETYCEGFSWYISVIGGTSENNIFVAYSGYDDTISDYNTGILHYDGISWSRMESGTSNMLFGIWGFSENEIIAVGQNGTVLNYSLPQDNPILLMTPDIQTIFATAGIATINISNSGTGTLTWTATENSPWFAITPKSGTNTGTITVNYESNPGDTRTATITITAPNAANSPKTITITQQSKQPHFTPVWTGNPYNAMRLWIDYAGIDGIPLSTGDEIAVFDGSKCVGVAIVNSEISAQNPLEIRTSADDGSQNGFTKGHQISFRLWDTSSGKEYTLINPTFKNATDGKPMPEAPIFEENADFGVSLESGTGQQSISLNKGWNIMSSNITPENTDMMAVVQPLINSGCLEKVISATGGTIIRIFGTWKNTIGNYNPDEGYKIKLNCETDFSVRGFSIQSQSNMYATSKQISLTKGWNIISYPFTTSQNAMNAVQPLIDSEKLIKVIDETGGTIIKVFGNWKNNIGDFRPGEGYEIKVSVDTYLTLKENSEIRRQGESLTSRFSLLTSHFTPVWTGNPYNPMNIWVAGITGYNIEPGDEIGIFDGDNCVGADTVTNEISPENPMQIIASQNDGEGSGFTEGNPITVRLWDKSRQTHVAVIPTFTDINGNPTETSAFKGKSDYGVTLDAKLNNAIVTLQILAGMKPEISDTNADADKNGKVEMADVIFILQTVSGIRK